ncbi:MAG: class A beta-lactamase-related serine hydrolase [Thermomicrobiales bacterium]|nr:class A beta-lactamase-related serine hydrolase [Thermomicrobiales bacterium]MCO5226369.1 class A beta-lactamase-related serine hydrolase [Thermomicrobiales bacterium]
MNTDVIARLAEERPDGTMVGISLRDLDTGETFAINGDHDFPSASTVKILILAALAEAVKDGRLDLDDKLPAASEIRLTGSGVVNWLSPDLELTLRDHAWLMTAISDNTTSNVLMNAIGIPKVNAVGTRLHVGGTRLGRNFMDRNIPPGPAMNRATATGLVNILTAIYHDDIATPELCAWMRQCLSDQQHTDRLPRHLPDGVEYAGKTGSVEGIVHDCGVLSGKNGRIAVAVLTQDFANAYDAERFIGRIGTAIGEWVV